LPFLSSASVAEPDPYAEQPDLLKTHGHVIVPAAVALLTVVLAVVSFPPLDASVFAYVMLVPGLFWAYLKPAAKIYFPTLFLAQAVAWTILLGWLHNVTWLGLLLLGPFTGAWVGLWYVAAWWTMPRLLGKGIPVRLVAMVGLCAVWVLLEWTRTWVLGGFAWLPLAASQWDRISILQVAAYTGAGGVSFVVVALNIGFAAYAHRLFREHDKSGMGKRSQEFFLAVFLLLACFSIQMVETTNRGDYEVSVGRVAVVQPYIPQQVKWDPAMGTEILATLEQTTLDASSLRPELILWPEAVTPWAVRGDAGVRNWVENLVRVIDVPLVLGSIAVEPDAEGELLWENGAFLVKPDTGLDERYYVKRHLVPFGEYVPVRPLLGWLEKVTDVGGDFTPGTGPNPLLVPLGNGLLAVGPLICFEDTYPGLARASVQAGSDVLAVLTNNAWFGEGGAAYQHAAHSVLRAVETRRPVLRVGNGGWSGWIDEFGVVRSVLTDRNDSVYFRGYRAIDVRRDYRWIGRESFYVAHGDWFVLVCAGLAVFGWLLLRSGEMRRKATRMTKSE